MKDYLILIALMFTALILLMYTYRDSKAQYIYICLTEIDNYDVAVVDTLTNPCNAHNMLKVRVVSVNSK